MKFQAYRVFLPDDGTHLEVLERVNAAGLLVSLFDVERVVAEAADEGLPATIGYSVDIKREDFDRITDNMEACIDLIEEGLGAVPDEHKSALLGIGMAAAALARTVQRLLEARAP